MCIAKYTSMILNLLSKGMISGKERMDIGILIYHQRTQILLQREGL